MKTEFLVWVIASVSHDWSDGVYLRKILSDFNQNKLIGKIDWLSVGYNEEPININAHEEEEIPSLLLKNLHWEGDRAEIKAGGENPLNWSIFISISKINAKTGFPFSANQINLEFDDDIVKKNYEHKEIQHYFSKLHSINDTDVANLHLRNQYYKNRAKESSIDFLFECLSWANFINDSYLNIPIDILSRDFPMVRFETLDNNATLIFFNCKIEEMKDAYFKKTRKKITKKLKSLL